MPPEGWKEEREGRWLMPPEGWKEEREGRWLMPPEGREGGEMADAT